MHITGNMRRPNFTVSREYAILGAERMVRYVLYELRREIRGRKDAGTVRRVR